MLIVSAAIRKIITYWKLHFRHIKKTGLPHICANPVIIIFITGQIDFPDMIYYDSTTFPSGEITTTCQGMNLPLA